MYRRCGKRTLDILASSLFLLGTLPIMVLTAVALRLFQGPNVMFRQVRPGLNGRLFTLYKFRTMLPPAAHGGQYLTEDQRITRVGSFVRRWSLDELPQLLNVVRGDMSLIGPRPLLVEYLTEYSPEQARRHEVRPGITGLAQVRGRNLLDWDARFRIDVEYVDEVSLALDLSIIRETIKILFTGRGVSPRGAQVMPRFVRRQTERAAQGVKE